MLFNVLSGAELLWNLYFLKNYLGYRQDLLVSYYSLFSPTTKLVKSDFITYDTQNMDFPYTICYSMPFFVDFELRITLIISHS